MDLHQIALAQAFDGDLAARRQDARAGGIAGGGDRHE
jgi:hypothetical protein